MGYRHIIWDWNGTLLDDVSAAVSLANEMLRSLALPEIDLVAYRDAFRFPIREYYERVGIDLSRVEFAELAARWIDRYAEEFPTMALRPDAIDALSTAAGAGLRQSILSATHESALHAQLDHHGLSSWFTARVGLPDHLAESKIARASAWIDGTDLRRSDVVLVGDTLHDLEVASHLGVDCILVEGGHHPGERLRAHSAAVERDLRSAVRRAIA